MATSSASLGGAPINALPAEVLSLIFVNIVDSNDDSSSAYRLCLEGNSKDLPSCVILTHVCRYWREVALNISALWTNLNLLSLKCTQEMLARSKEAPLKVFAVLEDYWHQPTIRVKTIHAALQHLSRIRELDLTHNGKDLHALVQTLSSPAPLLERMSLQSTTPGRTWEYLTESTFNGIAPRLRYVSLARCCLAKWDLTIFQHLVDFELHNMSPSMRPDIAGYLGTYSYSDSEIVISPTNNSSQLPAMLQNMPKLKSLLLDDTIPSAPHAFVSGGSLTSLGARPVKQTVHISRLTIAALEPIENNVWAIAYFLSHLSLPSLRHLHITCGASEGHLFELRLLLPMLAQLCHGSQDDAPIKSLVIVNLKWLSISDNNFVGVGGWTEPQPSNRKGALLPQLLNEPKSEMDSARFCFSFENVDSVHRGNLARSLAGILSTFPLSDVTSFAVDDTIDDLEHASWWIENHVRLPSVDRLYTKGNSFRTFCYAFVTNKTAPAMNYDKGTPLAVHRFLKHPDERDKLFDVPHMLEELVFPGLRTLIMIETAFEMKVFADLFIEALAVRKDYGVGIQSIEMKRCKVDRAYVARLREVVPEVVWDERDEDMDDMDDYRWRNIDSDGETSEDEEGSRNDSENGSDDEDNGSDEEGSY